MLDDQLDLSVGERTAIALPPGEMPADRQDGQLRPEAFADEAHVAENIRAVTGVKDIHHLNVWTICSHIVALSAHLDVEDDHKHRQADVIHAVEHMLLDRFHISHTTLQVECLSCAAGPIIKRLNHSARHSHAGH